MWPMVTPTFTHNLPQNEVIYNRRKNISVAKARHKFRTERLYLVHVLPFLYIFHVQHMADYLEEFLNRRGKDEMRRILTVIRILMLACSR